MWNWELSHSPHKVITGWHTNKDACSVTVSAAQHKATLCNHNNKEESWATKRWQQRHDKHGRIYLLFFYCVETNERGLWSTLFQFKRFPVHMTPEVEGYILCAGFKVNSMVHRFDLYLSCTGGIHAKLHAHSYTQRELCGSNTSKVNNLTGVKPSFSLPPPFTFALVFLKK